MAEVLNHDTAGMCQRLMRFREELTKSVSSGTSELNEFDNARLRHYLGAFNAYLDYVVGEKQLDLPESHPKTYVVSDVPEQITLESEMVNDVVRVFDVLYSEIINCQSSRKAAGLISFDEARFRALSGKLLNYLDTYVADYTPLDLPESSPQAAVAGPGRKGI